MKKQILMAWVILLLASLACNLPFGNANIAAGFPDPEADTFTLMVEDETILEPVSLSAAQLQILTTNGAPNRFTLMFADGVREETWVYDHLGYEVVFRDGEVFTESETEAIDAGGFISVYYPWQFNGEMGLSELLSVSGSQTFGLESLESVFEEDVSLVYLTGLDAGFRGERLLYIRTIPVGEGAREMPITVQSDAEGSVSGADAALSPAEAVHAGTHLYALYCVYSDGMVEEGTDQITWSFTNEGVYYGEDGPYPRVNQDYYGLQDSYGELFILFKENVVTITGESTEEDETGNPVVITFTCALTQED
jgi:hypothetical protein